jgi:hypothetical protein
VINIQTAQLNNVFSCWFKHQCSCHVTDSSTGFLPGAVLLLPLLLLPAHCVELAAAAEVLALLQLL